MFTFITKLLNYVPQPFRLIVQIGLVVLLISVMVWGFSQVQSCGYQKARKDYQVKEKAWFEERTKLIADAEAKEKRIAELEPQVLAYKAAADAGKKVDDDLAARIEQVGKDAGAAEAAASTPSDCRTRAARVCELLRANRIPHNCDVITAESCSR